MVTSFFLSGVCQRAEWRTSFPLQCQSCHWLSVCCWAPVPCWWKRLALLCLVCASSMISWCSAASRSSCKCLYAHYTRLLADVNYYWLALLREALGVIVLIFLHSTSMTTWRYIYQIISLLGVFSQTRNCLWFVDRVLRSSFSFRSEMAIISIISVVLCIEVACKELGEGRLCLSIMESSMECLWRIPLWPGCWSSRVLSIFNPRLRQCHKWPIHIHHMQSDHIAQTLIKFIRRRLTIDGP